MTPKWVWLPQDTGPLAEIQQLSTPGTGSSSTDVDGHQQSCIFWQYQQETPGDKLESEQEYGVGVGDKSQGHMLAPLPGTLVTAGDRLAGGLTFPGEKEAEQEEHNCLVRGQFLPPN